MSESSMTMLALGLACSDAAECDSGMCVNGVCCEVSSCEMCQTCGSAGKCVAGVAEAALAQKGGTPQGCACSADKPESCEGGLCSDGVCCATEVCPACMACNIEGNAGTCRPVDGVDDDLCQGKESCMRGTCMPVDAAASSSGDAYSLNSSTVAWAQTFEVRRQGRLAQLRLHLVFRNAQDEVNAYVAEVSEDRLPGRMITTLQRDPRRGSLPDGAPDFTPFTPASPLYVVDRQRLAIVVEARAPTVEVIVQGGPDRYSAGEALSRAGESWKPSGTDLTFQVLIAP